MVSEYTGNTYFLVRHGEALTNVLGVVSSMGGKREYPLTPRGQAQIQETAEYLMTQAPDFIVASPVLRARESAEIIQRALDIPLSLDERLCEPRFGTFEGGNFQHFLDFMQAHGTRAVGAPELGVEGYMDIRTRVRAFLASVNVGFQGKKIVIVSHADTLQELYAELLGEPIGAEQSEGHWFPENGACAMMGEPQSKEMFRPKA